MNELDEKGRLEVDRHLEGRDEEVLVGAEDKGGSISKEGLLLAWTAVESCEGMKIATGEEALAGGGRAIVKRTSGEVDPGVSVRSCPDRTEALDIVRRGVAVGVGVGIGTGLGVEVEEVDVEGRGGGGGGGEVVGVDDAVDDGIGDGAEGGRVEGGGRGVEVGADGGGDLGGDDGEGGVEVEGVGEG